MRKPTIVIISLAAITALAVVFIATRPAKDMPLISKDGPAPLASREKAAQASGGTYIDYAEDVIAKTSGQKVLFFHAAWCPQCRALEGDIKQSGVPAGVTIIKVDYDSNQELRQKYGVTLQTTLVKIDDQGNLLERYVAYNEPTLAAVKSNLEL